MQFFFYNSEISLLLSVTCIFRWKRLGRDRGLSRGVQRHPRRRKMRHGNPGGQNKEIRAQINLFVSRDVYVWNAPKLIYTSIFNSILGGWYPGLSLKRGEGIRGEAKRGEGEVAS